MTDPVHDAAQALLDAVSPPGQPHGVCAACKRAFIENHAPDCAWEALREALGTRVRVVRAIDQEEPWPH